ncbi:MAG: aldo/keto reductase [Gammaproteobacteria bacterium]|nr:aldo/keto reductase [Gammaproteobacteria bacterium]
MPLQSTWQAMEALVAEGLVKNIGVSNFPPSHLETVLDCATIAPVINQVECHPHFPQNALHQFCSARDIHLAAYSPLGSGIRPQTLIDMDEPALLSHPVISAWSKSHEIIAHRKISQEIF